MPRHHHRRSDVSRMSYSSTRFSDASEVIAAGTIIRGVSREYNISTTTLQNLASGRSNEAGKSGRKTALLANEERVNAQNLVSLADFGFALDTCELRLFVKDHTINRLVAV